MIKIAVIIPAYNEKENLPKLVDEIKSYHSFVEIYVIDDSKENFLEKDLVNKKDVHYFFRGKKLGRGSAVLYGLRKALKKNFEIYVEMDADFSHNPNELNNKIEIFSKTNSDLLIASRYLKKSKIINWSIQRRIFSRIANILASILLKIPVSDYTNGYRFYSKRAAEKIVNSCGNIGGGFIVLSEILFTLYKSNFVIGETDTIFKNRVRGESSVNLKLIFQSLKGLIKLYNIKKKLD
jgi:dolichol-phosphate mannosyltransferase